MMSEYETLIIRLTLSNHEEISSMLRWLIVTVVKVCPPLHTGLPGTVAMAIKNQTGSTPFHCVLPSGGGVETGSPASVA